LNLINAFIQVIPTLPPKWPLKVMSSFLARSFRRTVHARQEGRIVKAIAAGQNLDVLFAHYVLDLELNLLPRRLRIGLGLF
jgi:hypothetical protein